MKKSYVCVLAVILIICGACVITCCSSNDNPSEQTAGYIPKAPDYSDPTMWVTADGDTDGTGADIFYVVSTWEDDWTTADGKVCHYADVWNAEHRAHMADLEMNKVAEQDMRECSHIRPAEGETDTGVTICYNTVKDVKYVLPLISGSDICINPVNWRTDATPATLHDTITITVSPEYHVLMATNYSASEYPPFRGFLNVGDIHSCEPWLYSECLAKNIAVRAREWKKKH